MNKSEAERERLLMQIVREADRAAAQIPVCRMCGEPSPNGDPCESCKVKSMNKSEIGERKKFEKWANSLDVAEPDETKRDELGNYKYSDVAYGWLSWNAAKADKQNRRNMMTHQGTYQCPYCGKNTPHSHETRINFAVNQLLDALAKQDRVVKQIVSIYEAQNVAARKHDIAPLRRLVEIEIANLKAACARNGVIL